MHFELERASAHLAADPAAALTGAFESVQAHLRFLGGTADAAVPARESGACALVAYLTCDAVTVAGAGDCRAVLGSGEPDDGAAGGVRARELSVDHKADLPSEQARIEGAGGYVMPAHGCSSDDVDAAPSGGQPGGAAPQAAPRAAATPQMKPLRLIETTRESTGAPTARVVMPLALHSSILSSASSGSDRDLSWQPDAPQAELSPRAHLSTSSAPPPPPLGPPKDSSELQEGSVKVSMPLGLRSSGGSDAGGAWQPEAPQSKPPRASLKTERV